jgi:hypothetical protein
MSQASELGSSRGPRHLFVGHREVRSEPDALLPPTAAE